MYKFEYFALLFEKILANAWWKIIAGVMIVSLNFLFDGILKDAMIAVFLLVIFDFITGIMAVRHHPTMMIESSKLWRTAGKLGVYFMLISCGRLAEMGTSYAIPIIDETIIGFLAVTELYSILENIGRMGYSVPQDLMKKLSNYRDKK